MPDLKFFIKVLLIQLPQVMKQIAQLDACLKPWSARKVSSDNCLLMEVAHLQWYILVKGPQSWLSICDYSLYLKAQRLKGIACTTILIKRFALDLRPVDVDFAVWVEHNKISTCSSKENTVHDRYDLG
jgi:hypothetical protein